MLTVAPVTTQGGPPGGWDRGPGGPGGPGDHSPSPWDHNARWGPPPPDQAWRGIDQGRFDHQPFNYNGSWVTPIFNPDFNNWGFWFFGIWIPRRSARGSTRRLGPLTVLTSDRVQEPAPI